MGSIWKLLLMFLVIVSIEEVLPALIERSEAYAGITIIILFIFVGLTVIEVNQDIGLFKSPKEDNKIEVKSANFKWWGDKEKENGK